MNRCGLFHKCRWNWFLALLEIQEYFNAASVVGAAIYWDYVVPIWLYLLFNLNICFFWMAKFTAVKRFRSFTDFFQENPGIFWSIILFSAGREQYIKMGRASFLGTGKSIINIYFHGYFPEIINKRLLMQWMVFPVMQVFKPASKCYTV